MPIAFCEITRPVYLVAGDKDGDVPLAQAEQAKAGNDAFEMEAVPGGWHLLQFHPDWKNI